MIFLTKKTTQTLIKTTCAPNTLLNSTRTNATIVHESGMRLLTNEYILQDIECKRDFKLIIYLEELNALAKFAVYVCWVVVFVVQSTGRPSLSCGCVRSRTGCPGTSYSHVRGPWVTGRGCPGTSCGQSREERGQRLIQDLQVRNV